MGAWPIVNPGNLRHQIAFYARTVTQDPDTGIASESYDTQFALLYGELNPQGSRKFWDAMRFTTENLDTLSIPYIAGLDEAMQVRAQGRTFEIVNIQNVQERNVQLMLLLRELK